MSQTIDTEPTFATAPIVSPQAVLEPREITLPVKEIPETNSLFEHSRVALRFFRERNFRDDTERLVKALWPNRRPRQRYAID